MKNEDNMMTYSEFILCNLLREINISFNELEYDLMFGEAKRVYNDFYKSIYNNTKKGEYVCISEYLKINKLNEFKF